MVANAGISAGTASGGAGSEAGESAEQTRRIMAVNLDGVLNTVLPLVPRFRERGAGQIALMSSMAAFRGFPGAPAYCASKAAVKAWGESLRGWLGPEGVRVSVICPGFVESRITAANDFPMPFIMSGDKAAQIIKRGLSRDKGRIAFPFPTYLASWLAGALARRSGERRYATHAGKGRVNRLPQPACVAGKRGDPRAGYRAIIKLPRTIGPARSDQSGPLSPWHWTVAVRSTRHKCARVIVRRSPCDKAPPNTATSPGHGFHA